MCNKDKKYHPSPSKRRILSYPKSCSNSTPHDDGDSSDGCRNDTKRSSSIHSNNGNIKRKRKESAIGSIHFPMTSFWNDISNTNRSNGNRSSSSNDSQSTTQLSWKPLFQYEDLEDSYSKPQNLDSFIADQIITLPTSLSSLSTTTTSSTQNDNNCNILDHSSWPLTSQPLVKQHHQQQ